MSAAIKYTLARIGLFLVALVAVWPLPIDNLLKMMVAILVSAGLAFVFLRPLRDQVAERVADAMSRRQQERKRLRAALAGEDDPTTNGD